VQAIGPRNRRSARFDGDGNDRAIRPVSQYDPAFPSIARRQGEGEDQGCDCGPLREPECREPPPTASGRPGSRTELPNHRRPLNESILRDQLRTLLDWSDAHVSFDRATSGIASELHGARIDGFPHTLWQLVEHIRIAQGDILEFCRNPAYRELDWPAEYWPPTEAPPSEAEWSESLAQIGRDRAMLQALAGNAELDLASTIPHGSGQTYLREIVLVADHTAYHVGQIVALRRLLGDWKGA
jgi:uncharacterized damage-inducible protein DinB